MIHTLNKSMFKHTFIIQTSPYHCYYSFVHIAILLFYIFMQTYEFSVGELTNNCINVYRNDKTYFILQ